MKKFFALIAILGLTAAAHADGDGGGGYGTEDVIAAGGLTTVVGGCADAVVVQNGENSEITYTGPCHAQKAHKIIVSDYLTIFPSWNKAQAHCDAHDYVEASYGMRNWHFYLKGYTCAPVARGDGGGN